MVKTTALIDFIVHRLKGVFTREVTIPLTLISIIESLLGSKKTLKSNHKKLRKYL